MLLLKGIKNRFFLLSPKSVTPRSLVTCTKCTVLSALGHLGKQPWRQEVGEAGDLDLICDVALQQMDYQAK